MLLKIRYVIMKNGLPLACNIYNCWTINCESNLPGLMQINQLLLSVLLFFAGATAYSNAYFGQGSGPILLDNVACSGSENALVNCSFDSHTGDCYHSDDAGVRCYSTSTGRCEHGGTVDFFADAIIVYGIRR